MREIIGNTTATPNPRPDWNQTDPTKADYIRNKPEVLTREEISNLIPAGGDASFSMPIIRFVGLRGNKVLLDDSLDPGTLQFVIEVLGGGALQVGDTVQICSMRTFGKAPANSAKRRKLRRFAEHVVTEDDLDKRFLTVTVFPTTNAHYHLGHNNTRQENRMVPIYFRIRRPKGDLQNNESNMTVDAEFSNVVPVWISYYSATIGEERDITYVNII